ATYSERVCDQSADSDDEAVAGQLDRRGPTRFLAVVDDPLRLALQCRAHDVEQILATGGEDDSLALARGRGTDEHRTVQVAHAAGGVVATALRGAIGPGGGVVDDHGGRVEVILEHRDHLFHRVVVLEDHVDALGAFHGIRGRLGDSCAEAAEWLGACGGAIPDCYLVAAAECGLDECAAEEAGTDEGDLAHTGKIAGRNRWRSFSPEP